MVDYQYQHHKWTISIHISNVVDYILRITFRITCSQLEPSSAASKSFSRAANRLRCSWTSFMMFHVYTSISDPYHQHINNIYPQKSAISCDPVLLIKVSEPKHFGACFLHYRMPPKWQKQRDRVTLGHNVDSGATGHKMLQVLNNYNLVWATR